MKLNLGCGVDKREGFVNVDAAAACGPDMVVDLDLLPWPFEDDCAEEIVLSHILEHLGAETDTYLGILKELYRVATPGAKITIVIPHPRHDDFLHDPTHVRVITPESFQLYSKTNNRQWQASGGANTPLGLYLDIDFEVEDVEHRLDEPWRIQLEQGQITEVELRLAAQNLNNVIKESMITLRVIKPNGHA